MLRRCIWELSSGRSIGRRRGPIAAQMPFYLCSRNEFSTASQKNTTQRPAPAEETSDSRSSLSKLVLGSVVVGAAVITAYQTGYIDLYNKDKKVSLRSGNVDTAKTWKDLEHSNGQLAVPGLSKVVNPNTEIGEKNENRQPNDFGMDGETASEIKPAEEGHVPGKENELSSFPVETASISDEQTHDSKTEDNLNNVRLDLGQESAPEHSVVENEGIDSSVQVSEETDKKEAVPQHDTSIETQKDSVDNGSVAQKSLADSYSLKLDEGSSKETQSMDALASFLKDEEVSAVTGAISKDKNKPASEIVLDFIEAIHAAEKRQADLDAYVFGEEKRKLKEKYEKELKDARARELMYAEEAAILDKELSKEKAKAAAAIKSLQEQAEQKLQEELHRKEEEAEIQLKKTQELAKAELVAAIAKEKSSQIEKLADANMNIDALCMAFYARSEEARQTHSVHKLALGTLALEDALSKGLPIRAEVDALHKSLEGIDKDSLLELALSSLPEEAINDGTNTHMQLNQKFDSLKGTLRHFSLIPAGGGGLLAHTVAHIASSIKMREDQSGHGIESVLSQVESFLVQGKFAEAADALEGGVRGSEAEEVVVEWVKQARNRAVAEQALSLLQSFTTSIAFS